jgi:hypothetical protein
MSTATSTHTPRGQLDQPQVRAGLGEVALVTVVIALATPSGGSGDAGYPAPRESPN